MDNRYKLVLYNKMVYKEVELVSECKRLSIGTYYDDDVRLKKDLFFQDFYIAVSKNKTYWDLECSSNIYFDSGDVRKQFHVKLNHGSQISLRYQQSDSEFLKVVFLIDFDYENKKYDYAISVPMGSSFSIGGTGECGIRLDGPYVESDFVDVYAEKGELQLNIRNSEYGVYLNGLKVGATVKVHNYDFFSLANYYFYYKDNVLYTDSDVNIKISGLSCNKVKTSASFVYPKFNRNTRMKVLVPNEPISVLDPPNKPEKPKDNLLMSIMPALVMLILTVILRGFMGSGGTFVIFSACTISMGIVTSVVTHQQGKKEYKQNVENREQAYLNYIEQKQIEIVEHRNNERNILEHIYPNLNEVLLRVQDFSGELFDRIPEDEDYLCVRLGTGFTEAARKIQFKDQERFVSDDELTYYPQTIANKYKYLENSPIVLELRNANAVGVMGKKCALHNMVINITLDLAGRHYFGDVKFVYIMNETQKSTFEWVRFLPHVKSEGTLTRNIACDADSKTTLFEMLYKEFSWRVAHKDKNNHNNQFSHIVIFVLDASKIMTHPLSKFIAEAASINVTFLFFACKKEQLPLHCSQLISVNEQNGEMINTADANKRSAFQYQVTDIRVAEQIASRLAPVYCEEVNLEGSLVKSITLFDLLNIYSVEDLDLTNRWENSQVHKSMAAPLGVKTKNEVGYLDIHEKAHGPHGLVAGTTGSG